LNQRLAQLGIVAIAAIALLLVSDVCGQESAELKIKLTDRIPYGKLPVDYFSKSVDDAVAELNLKLSSGKISLNYDQPQGYLRHVLKLLNVPVESQLLVYSKTARSPNLVGPKSPRAIYFNDEISVAWIPDSKELELTALDHAKGANFYTLSQVETQKSVPTFLRRDRCLACHAARSSLEVPGFLLRGFQTDDGGKPLFGFSRVSHEKKIEDRFGGWFVTGSPAGIAHRGNLVGRSDNDRYKSQPGFRSSIQNLAELTAIEKYATNTSDWVAHLVLTHQMHGLNLMIRANLEERLGRHSDVVEQLVRYLVFADEAPLNADAKHPVAFEWQSSSYAKWFRKQGRNDKQRRSLRDFDLQSRLFRYRLSYLVELDFFNQMESRCRERIYRRLWDGLTTNDRQKAFDHMDSKEKRAIIEIVAQTKSNRPAYWKLPK
jgi:hypothetical protein